MKIRTAYFKVSDMSIAREFWQSFLGIEPHKSSDFWTEFRIGELNFALLKMDNSKVGEDNSNFVPVFEYSNSELVEAAARAQELGAKTVLDIADHPDNMSYVFADPSGNEFEITKFHD